MREHLEKEHLAAYGMGRTGPIFSLKVKFPFNENYDDDDDDDDDNSKSSQHSLNICPTLFWVFCNSQLWVKCKIHLLLLQPLRWVHYCPPFYRLSN